MDGKVQKKFDKILMKKIFEAIPINDRWFFALHFVGLYFYIIDEEIFENDGKVKKDNGKIGFLIFQIILFYLSLYYLSNKLRKKNFNQKYIHNFNTFIFLNPLYLNGILLFGLRVFIYLYYYSYLKGNQFKSKNSRNLFVGVIIGIMFAQRSASFLLIMPILVYYIIYFKKI